MAEKSLAAGVAPGVNAVQQMNHKYPVRGVKAETRARKGRQLCLLPVLYREAASMLQRAGNYTDAASVLLLNPQTQALEYVAGRGFRSRAIEQTQLRIGEDLPGRAALQRCVVGVGDLPHADEFKRGTLLASEKFTTYHAAPLVAKGQVKGIRAEQHRPADLPLDA